MSRKRELIVKTNNNGVYIPNIVTVGGVGSFEPRISLKDCENEGKSVFAVRSKITSKKNISILVAVTHGIDFRTSKFSK